MSEHKFVVCVRNDGYGASLELRKLYEILPDEAAAHGQIRIVDESGEDYLYSGRIARANGAIAR